MVLKRTIVLVTWKLVFTVANAHVERFNRAQSSPDILPMAKNCCRTTFNVVEAPQTIELPNDYF